MNDYTCHICNRKIPKKWGDFCLSHKFIYPFICINPRCVIKRIVYNVKLKIKSLNSYNNKGVFVVDFDVGKVDVDLSEAKNGTIKFIPRKKKIVIK